MIFYGFHCEGKKIPVFWGIFFQKPTDYIITRVLKVSNRVIVLFNWCNLINFRLKITLV